MRAIHADLLHTLVVPFSDEKRVAAGETQAAGTQELALTRSCTRSGTGDGGARENTGTRATHLAYFMDKHTCRRTRAANDPAESEVLRREKGDSAGSVVGDGELILWPTHAHASILRQQLKLDRFTAHARLAKCGP